MNLISSASHSAVSRRQFLSGMAGVAAGGIFFQAGRDFAHAAATDAGSGLAAGGLWAGVSVVDITPPVGHPMAGYGPGRNATGIAAPLLARVLILQNDAVSLALVSCDLVWLFSDRIVEEAKAKWGLDHVVLHGTHTHAGPVVSNSPIPLDHPEAWFTPMEDQIIAAIGEARAQLFPARISSASGDLDPDINLAYNRRRVREDGTVQMVWKNPKREPIGPIDPTVRVLRVDDARTGQPRVVLLHFAAHPVVLGPDNFDFSPDFAGFATAHIEQKLGDGVVSMFLQGGCGDTQPYVRALSGENGHRVARETGVSLGDNALRILQTMAPSPPPSGPTSLQVAQDTLHFARRGDPEQIEPVGVMAILIDRTIALGVISGEPFVQLQLDLVETSPVPDTYLLGYSYFGLGIPLPTYLPTVQAVKEGGYGAASRAFLEPAAGEKMIESLSALLQKLYNAKV